MFPKKQMSGSRRDSATVRLITEDGDRCTSGLRRVYRSLWANCVSAAFDRAAGGAAGGAAGRKLGGM